jgi:hypothetical protein
VAAVDVFYEDSRAGGSRFIPHDVAMFCAWDLKGGSNAGDPWLFAKRAEPFPMNGNSKVVGALERGAGVRRGAPTIVVLDHDKVRGLFALDAAACKADVLAELRKRQSSPLLHVVLLEQNLESILEAFHRCAGSTGGPKPTPVERDGLLGRCLDESATRLRACIMQQMPSFQRLVDRIVSLV